MIYFENVSIQADKKLVFTVKSTELDVHITEVAITTHKYYNNLDEPYVYKITPALVKITNPELVNVENEGEENEYEHFGNSFTYIIDLTDENVKMTPNGDISEDAVAFNVNKDLIILTAKTYETLNNAMVDCCHKKPAVGITYYKYCLFNKALGYVKTFSNDCEINKDFIDFILRHNALDLAISCGDVTIAIKLWNLIFDRNINPIITKNCGCHGR